MNHFNYSAIPIPPLPLLILGFLHCLCSMALSVPNPAPKENVFGSDKLEHGALIGILYDLKLNQQRAKTAETQKSYLQVITRFLDSGWDESILNAFYRTSRALYSTQVWIPSLRAERAPEAFGVAHVVKPTMWLVHYKGQVSPPESGTYRFVGLADNILCVAVNNETKLIAYIRGSEIKPKNWNILEPSNAWIPTKREKAFTGPWFEARKDEILDLDILTGERPGGGFYAFLMIEKKGTTYPPADDGRIKIPPFQLQGNSLTREYTSTKPWIGFQ